MTFSKLSEGIYYDGELLQQRELGSNICGNSSEDSKIDFQEAYLLETCYIIKNFSREIAGSVSLNEEIDKNL